VHNGSIPFILSTMGRTAGTAIALSLSLLLSLGIFLYQRSLEPHYGFVATRHTLSYVGLASLVIATFQPFKLSSTTISVYASIVFGSLPKALYWMAVWTARKKEPIYGPLIVHAVILFPLVSAFVFLASQSGVSPLLVRRGLPAIVPGAYDVL
jgi:hypothetical protein